MYPKQNNIDLEDQNQDFNSCERYSLQITTKNLPAGKKMLAVSGRWLRQNPMAKHQTGLALGSF